ncbi:beta-ketoacyl-ACP reductase [Desulfosarcina widdelii]|uniref:Beta-ketoacyl-ACP reductase n=1 Tax=Desulfosarcina widdelii TaxID=947919 RepID=A0A5K7Z4T6_9BACT|nr:3-oxoacyl-ACP reductase family protein [Desulfosarcina widdelii]BBO74621.1 beta-ketoacyl-ACP reductase [Desulfosarcina widdelii]
MKLHGKVALVTGASRGIGRAIAIALAKEGAFVAVNYVSNPSAAQEVVQLIEAAGSQAVAIQADISDLDAVEKMVASAIKIKGGIDILVNNAGVWRGGKLHKLEPADWDKVLDANLKGMLACTRAVLPAMLTKGSGKIINISSVIGIVGYPGDTVYGTSKAGIFGFTKSLAKEVAKMGINVNAVAPGIISTDMNSALDMATRSRLIKSIPMGALGKPEDVAEVVCFLACGASYVTGQVWTVDGGYTMMS